jgi:hypothetical protein
MMPGVPAVQLLVPRAAVAASIAFRCHHMEGFPGCPHSWNAGTKPLLRSSAEAVVVVALIPIVIVFRHWFVGGSCCCTGYPLLSYSGTGS